MLHLAWVGTNIDSVLQFTFPFSSLASTQPHLILSSPCNHLTTLPSRHLITSPPRHLVTLSPHHRLVTSLPRPHLDLALALVLSCPCPCLTPVFILDFDLVSTSSRSPSPYTPELSLSWTLYSSFSSPQSLDLYLDPHIPLVLFLSSLSSF